MPNANLHRDRDFMQICDGAQPAAPPEDIVDQWITTMPQDVIELILKGELRRRQYRAGFKGEKTDEFGRVLFQRIRLVVEANVPRFIEFRKGSEIGECTCGVPDTQPEEYPWPDNPDVLYCNECKKLTPRRY